METREQWNAGYDWNGGPWRPQGRDQVASMPPDVRKAYEMAAARYTFGNDVQFDAKGKPIENGIGSPGNMTAQAREALAKAGATKDDLKAKAGI